MQKIKNGKKNTAAAAEAESTLVVNVAQETEGRSKKRSSKDDNQRDTAAASEPGSTIVDTIAHETEGGSKRRSSKDDEQRGTAAALEAESTLVDTVVHETEGSTTMRNSEADNLRGGFAHFGLPVVFVFCPWCCSESEDSVNNSRIQHSNCLWFMFDLLSPCT